MNALVVYLKTAPASICRHALPLCDFGTEQTPNRKMGRRAETKRRRITRQNVERMALLSPIRRMDASDVLAILTIAGFNIWAWLNIAGLY